MTYSATTLASPGEAGVTGGFLRRIRLAASASGAGLCTTGLHWLDVDGTNPPAGLAASMLGPSSHALAADLAASTFFLVVPVPVIDPRRPLWLAIWDESPRSQLDCALMLAEVTELVAHAAMQRRRIAEARRRLLVERASATARIGIWSCTLPDETLTWSEGVYDLFELPRGAKISRQDTLSMYAPHSAREMQERRAEAIATLGDFNFDAEITTAKGNHRWMRITATVDGVDGRARRIFGMKQNITEEKLLAERTRRLAETDVMTGLANRSLFQARLEDLHGQRGGVPVGALLLIDLDRFKQINDNLGHAQGDACLIESGRRLRQCCPPGTLVARIGGDEFAVLTDARDTIDVDALSGRIMTAFADPFMLGGQAQHVGASIGIALCATEDGDALYRNADAALYAAKSAGRGTWRHHRAA